MSWLFPCRTENPPYDPLRLPALTSLATKLLTTQLGTPAAAPAARFGALEVMLDP